MSSGAVASNPDWVYGSPFCRGCGTPIEQPRSKAGKRRQWCTDRCRKDTLYSLPCPQCGGRMDGASGGAPPKLCRGCIEWDRTSIILALQTWAESHDNRPPAESDWRAAAEDHPSSSCVQSRWGSWDAAVRAAGYRPRIDRRPSTQTMIERRVRNGDVIAHIAADLGVTDRAIYNRLNTRGMTAAEVRGFSLANASRRLSADEVREIRRAAAEDGESQQTIGVRFGVSQSAVSMIVHRHTYADIA